MIAQQEEVKKAMSAESPSITAVSQPNDHLNLLVPETSIPWYKSFIGNIKEAIHPTELPPLEVTSKPIPVKNIWGDSKNTRKAGLSSVLIHGGGDSSVDPPWNQRESAADGQGIGILDCTRYCALHPRKTAEAVDGRWRRWR